MVLIHLLFILFIKEKQKTLTCASSEQYIQANVNIGIILSFDGHTSASLEEVNLNWLIF